MPVTAELVTHLWNVPDILPGNLAASLPRVSVLDAASALLSPGPFFYYVFDVPSLTFDRVSDSVEQVFACKSQAFSAQMLLDHLHPDEVHYYLRCDEVMKYFYRHCIPTDKCSRYKMTACFRLRVLDGSYRLFLRQMQILECDDKGEVLKIFGVFTDISSVAAHHSFQLSLVGLEGEPSFVGIDVCQEKPLENVMPSTLPTQQKDFTRRELEVIRLLGHGLSTAEIGERLRIAPQTVVTHRKNVLRKSTARNTAELVADCIRKGYI